MNPEEDKKLGVSEADTLNQAIAPEPVAPAPAAAPSVAPAAEPTPSLDQVAADLTSAAATDTLETPAAPAEAPVTPTEPPVAPVETPSEPIAPEPTPVPEPTPASGPVIPEPAAPITTPTTEPTPVAEPAPNPAADLTAPVEATPFANPAPIAPEPLSTPAPESPITPEASEIPGAAPATTPEEEPPLVPADPVPGSIGSAISYSDPSGAAPAAPAPAPAPKKSFGSSLKFSKDNVKLILIIGLAIVLVAIVVIVIIFIVSGSTGKKSSNSSSNTTPTTPTTPTVSSITCTKEGGKDQFGSYGEVVSGKEDIVVMYSDGYLDSFGSNLSLNYDNEEAARYGESVARESYNSALSASSLTSDPFDSSYDVIDNTLTVTHQASGDVIEASNARVLGFYVIKGEVVDDSETLIDNYETDGYTCVEK